MNGKKFLAIAAGLTVATLINQNSVFAYPTEQAQRIQRSETDPDLGKFQERKEASFILRGVQIVSEMDFSDREKAEKEIVEKYIGKEMTLVGLNNLTGEITKLYRTRGHIAAVAYIPAQKNENGVVVINVMQGFFDAVNVNYKTKISESKVSRIISRIKTGDPVNRATLEDVLYKINDIDGIKATAFLAPGKKEGSTVVNITIELDKRSRHILYTDNYGNQSSGRYRIGSLNDFYNLDKSGTKITVGGLASTQNSLDLYADVGMLNTYKGKVNKWGFHFGRSNYKLGNEYRDLDAKGLMFSWSLYGTTTVRKTLSSSFSWTYGLNYNNMEDDIDAFGLSGKKHSYTANVGIIGNERRKNNHFGYSGRITAGHLFNDSWYTNYVNMAGQTEGAFYKFNADIDYDYMLSSRLSYQIHASWQAASKNLDSSERMTFTGINGIKAYPTSDLSADMGLLARGMLIYKTGIPNLSMNLFIEHAEGKPRKSLDNYVYLHGYGIGMAYAKPDDYFIKMDYARRIGFDDALSERAKARGRFWFIAGKIF